MTRSCLLTKLKINHISHLFYRWQTEMPTHPTTRWRYVNRSPLVFVRSGVKTRVLSTTWRHRKHPQSRRLVINGDILIRDVTQNMHIPSINFKNHTHILTKTALCESVAAYVHNHFIGCYIWKDATCAMKQKAVVVTCVCVCTGLPKT